MNQLSDLWIYILSMGPSEVLDVLLVAALIYGLLYVVRGARAAQLLRGILILVLFVFVVSQYLQLPAFQGILRAILPAILVSVPVIFQPELRRAFERLGRPGLFSLRAGERLDSGFATVIALAARRLADQRHGALIVIERGSRLDELTERGVALDAALGEDLLAQIFYPNSPLHDGAVVVRNGRIAAARVVLPLGEQTTQSRGLGTRHLAAISITRSADVVAVVVSEESGIVSMAQDGRLTRRLDEGALAQRLYRALLEPEAPATIRALEPVVRPFAESAPGLALRRRLPGLLRQLGVVDDAEDAIEREPEPTPRVPSPTSDDLRD
ncbi:MAG: TIGR00159 family protein [Caldilineae bacterium]|nr:TIGR00159 family protein [Caldilineae bacterium]